MKMIISSPIGNILIAEREGYIECISLTQEPPFSEGDIEPLVSAAAQINEYFEGKRKTFDIHLRLSGTEFRKKVWNALADIPYGEVRTYGDIAKYIGKPGAARAVGGACHENPIAIVIPCHRVVASGSLGGYAYGTDIKNILLNIEKTCN